MISVGSLVHDWAWEKSLGLVIEVKLDECKVKWIKDGNGNNPAAHVANPSAWCYRGHLREVKKND